MPILTPSELANLRQDLRSLLPDLCDVTRTTETDDAGGGQTVSESVIDTDVPIMAVATRGRVQAGLTYQLLYNRAFEEADYQLTFPQDVDILLGDIVVVTTTSPQLRIRITALVVAESIEVVKQAGGRLLRED